MSVCPSHDLLEAFADEELAAEDRDAIASHLCECESCCRSLDELTRIPMDPPTKEPDSGTSWSVPLADRMAARLHDRWRSRASSTTPSLPQIPGYEPIRVLGRGGMGVVYLAWQHRLERHVAVKLLPPLATESVPARQRFAREISALGRLNHPGIVTAFDAGEHNGVLYLLMEYVEGRNLSELLRERGSLSICDACEIVRQAAEALQYAHEQGMIHRDVKPANLMLTEDGRVKLLDLGLARRNHRDDPKDDELTSTGQIIGTIDYMAPEQARAVRQVDIRTDIYSLGATLLKLITGNAVLDVPEGATKLEKLSALAIGQRRDLSEVMDGFPVGLTAVIQRMLADQPDDRLSDPAEAVQAVEPFCRGHALNQLMQAVATKGMATMESGETARDPQTAVAPKDSQQTRPSNASKNITSAVSKETRLSGVGRRKPTTMTVVSLAIISGLLFIFSNGPLVPPVDSDPSRGSNTTEVLQSPPLTPRVGPSESVGETLHADSRGSSAPQVRSPVGTSDSQPGLVQPEVTDRSQRALARWFVRRDGTLRIRMKESGERWYVNHDRPVPDEPFEIETMPFGRPMKATDEDLRYVERFDLTTVEDIGLGPYCTFSSAALLDLAPHLPNVRSINMKGLTGDWSVPTAGLIRFAKSFPNLEKIVIHPPQSVDNRDALLWAKSMAKLPHLREIEYIAHLTRPCLEELSKSMTLESVVICDSPVVDEDLRVLRDFPNLYQLTIDRCQNLTAGTFHELGAIQQLKHVGFRYMPQLLTPQIVELSQKLRTCEIKYSEYPRFGFTVTPETNIEEYARKAKP